MATNISLLVLTFSTLYLRVSSQDCKYTSWSDSDDPCVAPRTSEIFKEVNEYGRMAKLCCVAGSKQEENQRSKSLNCRATKCVPANTENYCSTIDDRYLPRSRTALKYEEVLEEPCATKHGVKGVVALCCRPNSKEGFLVTTMGAEPHEFPHQAKIKPVDCGGTIYNKKFVLTAAHCVVDRGEIMNAKKLQVILGSNIGDNYADEYKYQVKKVIVHKDYGSLYGKPGFNPETGEGPLNDDMALLEVDRDIKFSSKVKALEIAQKGFDPFKYADKAAAVGWGTTDTGNLAIHLQKTDFLLRSDEACFGRNGVYWEQGPEKDRLICVGGVLENTYSATAGGGDSGGPLMCRREDGRSVLCGVTSFGGESDEKCAKYNNEEHCSPSVYVEVGYYRNWIEKHAGKQDPRTFYTPYLYGRDVPEGEYDHQVHITSMNGKSCGGTLVAPDIVVTAAQCVARADGTSYNGLEVTTGIKGLDADGETFQVKMVGMLSGFSRSGKPVDTKAQGKHVLMEDNYYNNDLAVLKLNGKAKISQNQLPSIPDESSIFTEGVELSFPRNTTLTSQMRARNYTILSLEDCQRRFDRMKIAGVDVKIQKTVLCGVEKYSGGSTCDRELGGGLICKGENGKEVLCGVQILRLCKLTIPNGFMNIGTHSRWVKGAMKSLAKA